MIIWITETAADIGDINLGGQFNNNCLLLLFWGGITPVEANINWGGCGIIIWLLFPPFVLVNLGMIGVGFTDLFIIGCSFGGIGIGILRAAIRLLFIPLALARIELLADEFCNKLGWWFGWVGALYNGGGFGNIILFLLLLLWLFEELSSHNFSRASEKNVLYNNYVVLLSTFNVYF